MWPCLLSKSQASHVMVCPKVACSALCIIRCYLMVRCYYACFIAVSLWYMLHVADSWSLSCTGSPRGVLVKWKYKMLQDWNMKYHLEIRVTLGWLISRSRSKIQNMGQNSNSHTGFKNENIFPAAVFNIQIEFYQYMDSHYRYHTLSWFSYPSL